MFGDMFRKRLIQNSKLNIGYLFIGEKIELVYKWEKICEEKSSNERMSKRTLKREKGKGQVSVGRGGKILGNEW